MNLDHTGMTEFTAADLAYEERNRVVAALARVYPSGLRKTAIAGWDPAWHNCVFIDLPLVGQVSWHFHDREAPLFDGLPPYTKPWDGHTTPQKYARLADLARLLDAHPPVVEPGWLDRVLIRLGLMAWCDRHLFHETHGDQRNQAGARFVCLRCPAKAGELPG